MMKGLCSKIDGGIQKRKSKQQQFLKRLRLVPVVKRRIMAMMDTRPIDSFRRIQNERKLLHIKIQRSLKRLQVPVRKNRIVNMMDTKTIDSVCGMQTNLEKEDGHPDYEKKLGSTIDDNSSSANDNQMTSEETRRLSIHGCLRWLVHASQCDNNNCQLRYCQRMKSIFKHTKVCVGKTNGSCLICKQFVAVCYYHVNNDCRETKCRVPYCSNIKEKLKEQQSLKESREALAVKKRIVIIMNTELNDSVCDMHSERQTVHTAIDLSANLEETDGHPNYEEKLSSVISNSSSCANNNQLDPQEAREISIQKCLQQLVHADQCQELNCQFSNCQKMKGLVTHFEACKQKANSDCLICKQFNAFRYYHAKNCKETNCLVPFCSDIKHKLKQQ